MQRVRIGSLYNLDDQSIFVKTPQAVGLVVISSAFPRGVVIASSGGNISQIPLLRGQKLWLPTQTGYKITYPDTWAGNVDTSSYGNWNTFEPENPETMQQNADGELAAIVFYNKEDFDAYQVGRLEEVLFVPRLEGLDSLSELYSMHNVDFDAVTIMVQNVSDGYYNCFRIEEGNATNPADVDGFAQTNRNVMGYLTADYKTSASDSHNGYCVLTGVHSIRILQIASDVTAGTQRCFLYMRFHNADGIAGTGKRGGRMCLRFKLACPNAATTFFDVPTIGQASWSIVMLNSGANLLTTRVFRAYGRPDSNTIIDPASDLIASAAHAPAAIRSGIGVSFNGADLARISAAAAAGVGELSIVMTGYI